MKIIFAGTPDFAAVALKHLIDAGHEIALVLSQPDRPSGRGMKLTPSPVKKLALEHGIPVITPVTLSLKKAPEESARIHADLKAVGADLLVVAAYGLILPQAVLDCAKGIGLVATNGGKISDYEGVDQAHEALPPLVAVNTTAGTASEITRFCIITDTTRKVKMCIVDWRVTPAIAINDPELMVGMPASLTAATGMDALTHAVEAYVSTAANPLTDAAAIKAIDKIVHYLPQAVANGDYMKARSEMAYAQYLAGVAFNNASLGYVHAMAHQLGGFYNLPHGVCNAILLPYVQEFNLIGNLERFAVIAETMDINVKGMSPFEAGEACVYALKTFGKYLGIPQNLRSLGVKPEDFEIMAEHAMQDACAATNPRKATKEQIIAIGDNENDVEMFKEAGISVAMENAKDPVKQQADFVAADNDHDGAAEFLEKFLYRLILLIIIQEIIVITVKKIII